MGEMRMLKKQGTMYALTLNAYYTHLGYEDARYKRKVHIITTAPTPEAWERYHAAKGALKILEAYEGTRWGGPEEGTEVHEPEWTHEYEWLETEKEWLERCRELDKSGG